eukprot:2416638-Pleurochrysis_carterae.AAC.1
MPDFPEDTKRNRGMTVAELRVARGLRARKSPQPQHQKSRKVAPSSPVTVAHFRDSFNARWDISQKNMQEPFRCR